MVNLPADLVFLALLGNSNIAPDVFLLGGQRVSDFLRLAGGRNSGCVNGRTDNEESHMGDGVPFRGWLFDMEENFRSSKHSGKNF
jgi:hypothetical protein